MTNNNKHGTLNNHSLTHFFKTATGIRIDYNKRASRALPPLGTALVFCKTDARLPQTEIGVKMVVLVNFVASGVERLFPLFFNPLSIPDGVGGSSWPVGDHGSKDTFVKSQCQHTHSMPLHHRNILSTIQWQL